MLIYIAVSVSLFVAFTNFIVLALICSLRRLQTLRNVPLAGLATADILVGIFWIPLATASSYFPENKGLCRAALSCEILTMHASLFNLIAVSAERWIAIFKPLHYHQIASKTVVLSLIAVPWFISFAMLVAFLLADKHDDGVTECDIVKYTNTWLLYVILVIFYIVCGIMILMQMKVYFIVREQIRKIRPTAMPGNVTNGLIAATSFIIDKSFKIDESSSEEEKEEDAEGQSENLSRRSEGRQEEATDCEGTCANENEAANHALAGKRQKRAKNGKTKRKLLTLVKEDFRRKEGRIGGSKETMKLGLPETNEVNIDRKSFRRAEELRGYANATEEMFAGLKRSESLKESFTSESTEAEKIDGVDTNFASAFHRERRCMELRSKDNHSIFSVRTGNGKSYGGNENASIRKKRRQRTRPKSRRASRRKEAYYSPDLEDLEQKATGGKRSFASFVRLFSVIKTQRKLEFARAAATNIVCLCFVLMWAPKSTIDLLTGLGYCESCSLAHSVSAVLAWMNSGINALIYAWRMHEFRGAIRAKVLGKRKRILDRNA